MVFTYIYMTNSLIYQELIAEGNGNDIIEQNERSRERYHIRMKKRTEYLLSGALLLFAVLLRTYQIAITPLEMHIDEAGLGLNAWSIANYGTDRYGNFLPVCPSNFYGEQSAFYTYFCALLVKFFGLNIYTLRAPGVIMGIVTVFFGSLLMKEKWGKKGLFTGLALLGIFPYFIMNCRFALDCNAMLGTLTLACYSLVRLLKKAEQEPERGLYGRFALTGLLFAVVLYTYIIAALVVAVFCTLFGLYYLFQKKENRLLRLRQLLCLALPLCLLALPLILVVCVNYFDLEPIVTPFFSIPKMMTNRTEEVSFSLSALPGKLRALLYPLTTDGKYGSSDRYWTMYWWSVPLVALGIFAALRQVLRDMQNRKTGTDICMLFLAVSEVVMFVLCGQYNYHINGIFIALAYFCLSGIFFLGGLFKTQKQRLACGAVLVCLYGGAFAGFAAEYYGGETQGVYQVYGGVSDALSLLSETQKEREIYVLDEVGEFYFLSNPVSPSEFTASCDELGYIRDYGNLHFHEPEGYRETDIYICSKASGRYYALSDTSVTGYDYSVLETEYYYVFY